MAAQLEAPRLDDGRPQARLAAAVDRLRDAGHGTYRHLDGFSPAVAGQFGVLGDVDGESSESIDRIGGTR